MGSSHDFNLESRRFSILVYLIVAEIGVSAGHMTESEPGPHTPSSRA